MDIENLNKFQIILVVLMVSFVTSIATGIITVTLLAQAPPAVTETINHVVERTIQTIVPQAASSTPQQTTTTQTVIVKEDDLITGSIAGALKKTGRIFGGTATSSPVVGLGAVIAPGVVVTDSDIVSKEQLVSIGNTTALFALVASYPDMGIAVLTPESTSTSFTDSFTVADASTLKLGSTVTAILGVSNERVAIGSISALFSLADVSKKDGPVISVRAVDTNLSTGSITGEPLVNIFGDLVGISTGVAHSAGGSGTFVAASDIIKVLASKATTTPAH